MAKATQQNVEERKKDIMEAALYCFLNFGYSKTSMDDVAKKAGISRPLIYLKFKNKEDLLLGLFDHIMDGRLEEAEKLIDNPDLSKKEKLLKMFEIVKLEPWGKISGCPMSQEFFDTCHNFDEKAFEKFEKQKLSIVAKILGDKQMAEVFIMAFDGLLEDQPTCAVLKKRMEVLIDKFAR